MIETSVVVVGAGLAGLHAARLLHLAGVDVMVVEARDRLGGRILSTDWEGRPSDDGFDLGPSWYWPLMQPAIGGLVEQLGLESFAQASEGDVIFERMSRETPRRYHATRQEPEAMRLVGGTSALVRALAKDLPTERVLLRTRVASMALSDEGILTTCVRSDGSSLPLLAKHVIAALPPRSFEASVAFSPAQEPEMARRWRDTPTWMAPHAKFFAFYERPFWREAGLSGTAQSMVGPLVEIHDATTASGRAALFGFLGVVAEQRLALGEATLAGACVGQLVRLFGPQAAEPSATLFKDWAADALTATPADRVAEGHFAPDSLPWVTGPWRARLTLAGSETSPTDPGYLAGAVAAAQRAVDETLAKLR